MSSGWANEISAVLGKELRTEWRDKTGLMTALVFSIAAVICVAFSAAGMRLGGTLAAGLFWLAMLFAAIVGQARSFLAEEDHGTADLLRLMARPHAVFWGKALYNLLQGLFAGAVLGFLFIFLLNQKVPNPALFALSILGGAAALSGVVTLCSALVSQAAYGSALAGAIALPLLIPLLGLAVSATQVAFGAFSTASGLGSCLGLLAYAVSGLAIGPYLYAAVWKS